MDTLNELKKIIRETIHELIDEGFVFTGDNSVKFDPSSKEHVNTSLGKAKFAPRKSTLKRSGVTVLSAYSKESGDATTQILKALKGSTDIEFPKGDVDKFINRTAVFFARVLRDQPIDVVLKMPSSSPLASNFTDKILEKISHSHVLSYKDVISKDLTNISVSKDTKFSPDTLKSVYKFVDKVKDTGKFEIKKLPPRFRPLVVNWIKIDDSIKNKLVGKNILVVDDYLTTGTTLDETCSALKVFVPASITGITLIK